MGFFNDKQVEAFETGRYICSECGAVMEFEDKWEDVLIMSASIPYTTAARYF